MADAVKIICRHASKLVNDSSFLSLTSNVLSLLLSSDNLSHLKEVILFDQVVAWCETNGPTEEEAMELLNKIRFGLFEHHEFAEVYQKLRKVHCLSPQVINTFLKTVVISKQPYQNGYRFRVVLESTLSFLH
jgi:hypothetical protein